MYGTMPDGTPLAPELQLKLDKEKFFEYLTPEERAMYEAQELVVVKPYVQQGGTDPALVAKAYGYESFHDYLADLNKYPPVEEAADIIANNRADEQLEGMPSDEAIKEMVMEDVDGKLRLKVTLWEQEILARKNFKGTIKKISIKGIERTPMNRAVKEAARQQVATRSLRDTANGKVYDSAARKWAREAVNAFKRGDSQGVLNAKRKEAYNLIFLDEVKKMQKVKERLIRTRQRFKAKNFRKKLTKVRPEMMKAIDELLADYQWTKNQSSAQKEEAQVSGAKHLSTVTGKELELLMGALLKMRDGAAFVIKEEEATNKIEFEKKIGTLVTDLDEVKKGLPASIKEGVPGPKNRTLIQKARVKEIFLLKAETILLSMDLGKKLGKWWKAIYEPLEGARDAYHKEMEQVKNALQRILDKYYNPNELRALSEKTIKAGGKTWSKEDGLAILGNYGNPNGRKRLRNNGVTDEIAQEIFLQLSDKDFAYVQEMVDYMGSFWDRIYTLEAETKGRYPKKVEALSFEVGDRTVKGGYFPIKYDKEILGDTVDSKGLEPDQLMSGSHFGGVYAQTNDGHTYTQAEEYDAPLDLSIEVAAGHIQRVVYDLNYRKPVLEVAAVLRDKRVKKALEEGIGTGAWDNLSATLQSVARDSTVDQRLDASLDRFFRAARRNTSFAMMGYSIRVALLQPLGLWASAAVVGGNAIAREFVGGLVNPVAKKKRVAMMKEQSTFMKERMATFDRDVYEYVKLVSPELAGKGVKGKYHRFQMQAFSMMSYTDMYTSTVTWLAAFDKALLEGYNDKEATQIADQAVRRSQGSGARLDVSRVQSYNELTKLFTMFYNYFSTILNEYYLQRRLFRGDRISALEMTRVTMFLIVIPKMIEEAVIGRGEDDEDWAGFARRVALSPLKMPLLMYPLLREGVGVLDGYAYQGSPVFKLTEQTWQVLWSAVDAPFDDDGKGISRKNRTDFVNSMGLYLGFPAAQSNRIIDAMTLLLEGKTDAIDTLRIMSIGPNQKERRTLKK